MEVLKLKIFNVLTEKVNVSVFENWMYNSEEFMSQLHSIPFYFDVISINYKIDTWDQELNDLAKNHLNEDYLEILKIKKTCLQILELDSFKDTLDLLNVLLYDFDFDTDYSVLWKLYLLKDYFDLALEGLWKKDNLVNEAKFYSKQTIEIITNEDSFYKIKTMLEEDLTTYKISKSSEKESIKQKIFAFFKKS